MKRMLLSGLIALACATSAAGPTESDAPTLQSNLLPLVPVSEARVASPALRDTLEHRVTAGDDLIVTLPGTLSNRSVTAYELVRAPALSWVVDRSLLWRTRPEDAGTHALLVEATFDDAPSDTLTVLVEVTD